MRFDLGVLLDGLELGVISSCMALQQVLSQGTVLLLRKASERGLTGEEGVGDPLRGAVNADGRRLTCHVAPLKRSNEAPELRAGVSPGAGAKGQVERLDIIR